MKGTIIITPDELIEMIRERIRDKSDMTVTVEDIHIMDANSREILVDHVKVEISL